MKLKAQEIDSVVFGANQILHRYHSRDDVIHSYKRRDKLGGKIRQRLLMPMALKLMPSYGQKEVIDLLKSLGFKIDR